MRHVPPDLIRLKAFHRRLLYGVLALLFLTGAAWAYWNFFVPSPSDFELGLKALAMKMHGAAAMAILVLIGMLLTGHVRFAWRARSKSRQRLTISRRVRPSDRHRIRALLRQR